MGPWLRAVAPVFVAGAELDLARSLRQLAPSELSDFSRLELEPRRREWLAGRLATKRAVQRRTGLSLLAIEVTKEPSGRPIVAAALGVEVSVSHSEGVAVAVATSGRVGIDLELVRDRRESFERLVFGEAERAAFPLGPRRALVVTQAWCAKEALAKARGTGLRASFPALLPAAGEAIEVGAIELAGRRFAYALAGDPPELGRFTGPGGSAWMPA